MQCVLIANLLMFILVVGVAWKFYSSDEYVAVSKISDAYRTFVAPRSDRVTPPSQHSVGPKSNAHSGKAVPTASRLDRLILILGQNTGPMIADRLANTRERLTARNAARAQLTGPDQPYVYQATYAYNVHGRTVKIECVYSAANVNVGLLNEDEECVEISNSAY